MNVTIEVSVSEAYGAKFISFRVHWGRALSDWFSLQNLVYDLTAGFQQRHGMSYEKARCLASFAASSERLPRTTGVHTVDLEAAL